MPHSAVDAKVCTAVKVPSVTQINRTFLSQSTLKQVTTRTWELEKEKKMSYQFLFLVVLQKILRELLKQRIYMLLEPES